MKKKSQDWEKTPNPLEALANQIKDIGEEERRDLTAFEQQMIQIFESLSEEKMFKALAKTYTGDKWNPSEAENYAMSILGHLTTAGAVQDPPNHYQRRLACVIIAHWLEAYAHHIKGEEV